MGWTLYVNSMAVTCEWAQKNDQSSVESIIFLEMIQSDKYYYIEHDIKKWGTTPIDEC